MAQRRRNRMLKTVNGAKLKAQPNSNLVKKMNEHGYLTLSQAADRAGVHRSTTFRWVQGGLTHRNVSGALFIHEADLVALLERRRQAQLWLAGDPTAPPLGIKDS